MPPYALAIFDFDGTLADSWRLMGQAIVEAADRFGYRRLSPDEVQHLRGQDNRAVMQALGVKLWQLPGIAVHMRQVALDKADHIALFPGVHEMLVALARAGVRIAVVSSNGEEAIRRVLGGELSRVVHDYDCGAAIFGKAAKFRRVVRRADVAPAEAIAIGDEARDIDAATAAGVASGAVTWGYATPGLLESRAPTHIFRSIDEVTSALTGVQG
jgi:phosphoglycolate phosphatase